MVAKVRKKITAAEKFTHFDRRGQAHMVDVGAKIEIYHLMNRLTAAGAGIVMISSELPELLGMSDRILVMHRGRLHAEFQSAEATESRVLSAALGLAS